MRLKSMKRREPLRQRAPALLRADQAGHTRRGESNRLSPLVRITPTEALSLDSDHVCIRDEAGRATLSPDQQKAFTQLWADVATLR